MTISLEFIKESGHEYIETCSGAVGTPLVLLHGLMGALSNFRGIVDHFGEKVNVVVPMLPIYTMPLKDLDLDGLVDYIHQFITFKQYDKVILLGNSLGGHLAQMYALRHPEKVDKMILTGSSGLFENAFGSSFPKRSNKDYIRSKTEMVFYDPAVATEELVDDVFHNVSDLGRCIRIVKTAKSAVRHNLENLLPSINTKTLLVWGAQDEVTPLWVGQKFHELLKNSKLVVFDKCGHAPMMELPAQFNHELENFLNEE
jgi:2-hydroxy-6-oxonona-2,4-dienedioate hydrolase